MVQAPERLWCTVVFICLEQPPIFIARRQFLVKHRVVFISSKNHFICRFLLRFCLDGDVINGYEAASFFLYRKFAPLSGWFLVRLLPHVVAVPISCVPNRSDPSFCRLILVVRNRCGSLQWS